VIFSGFFDDSFLHSINNKKTELPKNETPERRLHMDIMHVGLLPESLVIDLPEVDAQHEEIFIRIESLKSACFDIDYNPLGDFETLLAFFEHHFATEERIAKQGGLEFSDHIKTHGKGLRVLNKALDDVRSGARDAYSLLRYIELWFERHINEQDKLFAASLQSSACYRPSRMPVDAGFLDYKAGLTAFCDSRYSA
jgi:hemerythrin-like metal-binding protein